MKYTFDDLKKNISLPDFLKYAGFYPTDKSSRNFPVLYNESTDELFVIKKNQKDHFIYWDPRHETYHYNHKTGEKYNKTILDYVIEHYKKPDESFFTLSDARKFLIDYINSDKFIPPNSKKSEFSLQNNQTAIPSDHYLNLLYDIDKESVPFLKNRGIKINTINNPQFFPIVKKHIFDDPNINITHTNLAFLLRNEKGICSISLRNDQFKQAIGARGDGLCASQNFSTDLDSMYIFEDMLDGLSHFQLFNPSNNTRYIATQGNPSHAQLQLISKAIDKQNPKSVNFCFDNDLSGDFFKFKFYCELSNNDTTGSLISSCTVSALPGNVQKNKPATLFFQYKGKDNIDNIKMGETIQNVCQQMNNETGYDDLKPFTFATDVLNDGVISCRISFKYNRELINVAANSIFLNRFNSRLRQYNNVLSTNKDFNEDLIVKINNDNDLKNNELNI